MYRQAFDVDSEMKYRFLRDLGFANQTTPIDVKGINVIPFQVLWTLLEGLPPEEKRPAHIISEGNCIVRGWKDGGKVEVKTHDKDKPRQ